MLVSLDNAVSTLRRTILELARLEKDRIEVASSPMPAAWKAEQDQELQARIDGQRRWIEKVLLTFVDFPPRHMRHEQPLGEFNKAASFEDSVFIITKFPNTKNPTELDNQLGAVIQLVRDAVAGCKLVPRVASDAQYHNALWDNVELYLLGCKRGIAIVEDKYLPELNPNVAMEWGWMRGMGRNVLYLIEKDFRRHRADWGGLIERSFDWGNPGPDIKTAVEDWLKKP